MHCILKIVMIANKHFLSEVKCKMIWGSNKCKNYFEKQGRKINIDFSKKETAGITCQSKSFSPSHNSKK